MNVLVVEDDPSLREVETMMLMGVGYSVAAASNVTEALDMLEHHIRCDVIVTDYMMPPGPTGIDLARTLRESGSHIPIVLITGDDSVTASLPRDIQLSRIIKKPFPRQVLLDCLLSLACKRL